MCNPAFVRQYAEGAVYNNSLVVESAERHTYVSHEDIYEYDYTDYYSTGDCDLRFAGESALTGAIDRVTGGDLPRMYTLMGHGEPSMSAAFKSAVEKENVDIVELTLLAEGVVPEEADCILIHDPQRDISEEERELLLAYLQGGGKLLLITDPPPEEEPRPNLEMLMEYYGVSANRGIVIEGRQGNYALGTPYYLLPNIESHTITAPLGTEGYYVLLPLGQGLTAGGTERETLSVTELLTTSSAAFSKIAGYALESYEKERGDISGPFALAVAVTESIDEEKETGIVWVSAASLLDEQTNMQVSGGNQDFFLNSIHWLCGKEQGISIHAKSLAYDYLTMDSGTSTVLTLLIVGLLPLGYLGIGISTWTRRKKR